MQLRHCVQQSSHKTLLIGVQQSIHQTGKKNIRHFSTEQEKEVSEKKTSDTSLQNRKKKYQKKKHPTLLRRTGKRNIRKKNQSDPQNRIKKHQTLHFQIRKTVRVDKVRGEGGGGVLHVVQQLLHEYQIQNIHIFMHLCTKYVMLNVF